MSELRGRPPASSREMLAEAAGELFLEQGFEATTVADIANRAGLSRASFFNYFSSKSDLLWLEIDERIDVLRASSVDRGLGPVPEAALSTLANGAAPLTLALAITDESNMGVQRELWSGSAERQQRIAEIVADRLRARGIDATEAVITGAATAAGFMVALWQWASAGAGRKALDAYVTNAAATLARVLSRNDAEAARRN